jgi:hypothetical protein
VSIEKLRLLRFSRLLGVLLINIKLEIATNTKQINMSVNRRGAEIRFVGGTYIGYKGWVDNSKEETAKSTPVIVHSFKKKDGSVVDKATTVRKTSIRPAVIQAPTSYAEAILQQHPKIEQMLDKLCTKLAKCEAGNSGNSLHEVFHKKMLAAIAKQNALGADAEWILVLYEEPQAGNGTP